MIAFVVAVARNGVIGRDGDLPWRLSTDLKLFRRLTLGKPIIMGRRTWSSLKRQPLDQRDNIVVTRDPSFAAPGALITRTPGEALALGRRLARERGTGEVMVIGGAQIYRALMPEAGRIYLTWVDAEPAGDAHFDPLDAAEWRVTSREPLPRGDKDDHSAELVVYERRAGP